jgi:glucokinase
MADRGIIIGIDLGGTKVLSGVVTPGGEVAGNPVRLLTLGHEAAELVTGRIIQSVEEALAGAGLALPEIRGIGIGATGPLDPVTGTILDCPQLPTLLNFPLKQTIEKYFNVPVLVNNDANCMVLGESCYGAGRGHNTVVGLTLGTGLGCAIVINRKIYDGSTGTAAEIWMSPYHDGTIEDFISGAGVSRIYKSLAGSDRSSLDIFNLAKDGDPFALKTWDEFGSHLAFPLAWVINMVDPDMVVIGGSIAAAFDFFSKAMEEKVRKWICPVPAEKTRIVRAELGDCAGFVGAACLFNR